VQIDAVQVIARLLGGNREPCAIDQVAQILGKTILLYRPSEQALIELP